MHAYGSLFSEVVIEARKFGGNKLMGPRNKEHLRDSADQQAHGAARLRPELGWIKKQFRTSPSQRDKPVRCLTV
jgi:hypothetical protein